MALGRARVPKPHSCRGRGKVARFESSVRIDRPVEEVFAFLTELGNSTQWQSWLVESVKTSEGPVGLGTTCREVRRLLGLQIETTGEVTEWEPNRRTTIKSTSGPVSMQGTCTFEPVEGGTRVTAVTQVDIGGLFNLAGPALGRIAQRQIDTDVATLKDLLESGDGGKSANETVGLSGPIKS